MVQRGMQEARGAHNADACTHSLLATAALSGLRSRSFWPCAGKTLISTPGCSTSGTS